MEYWKSLHYSNTPFSFFVQDKFTHHQSVTLGDIQDPLEPVNRVVLSTEADAGVTTEE